MAPSVTKKDLEMMARCIELSRHAISQGEFPFACVICKDGDILVETTNRVKRDTDVTKHAEMVAMSEAQKKIGKVSLSSCTLYTNVDPCAMCSYCIRETRINRVIYAIPSPIMGGFSQWKILQGKKLSTGIPEIFGRPPFPSPGGRGKLALRPGRGTPGTWRGCRRACRRGAAAGRAGSRPWPGPGARSRARQPPDRRPWSRRGRRRRR